MTVVQKGDDGHLDKVEEEDGRQVYLPGKMDGLELNMG